jgi:capsular exopolysaccharide synthesis family protein
MTTKPEQNVADLFKKALNYWYWFALSLAVAVGLTWYNLAHKNPVWEVKGSILVQEDQTAGGTKLPGEAIMQGSIFRNNGNLDHQIQVLKSRSLMEKVIGSLGIETLYQAEHKFRKEDLYKQSPVRLTIMDDKEKAYGKELRIKQLDDNRFAVVREGSDTLFYNYGVPFLYEGINVTIDKDSIAAPVKEIISIQVIRPRFLAAWYSSMLTFQKQAQSNVISVAIKGDNFEKLIDILYRLVDVYNYASQEEKNLKAQSELKFINDRLSYLNSELFQVESRQAGFKAGSGVTTDVDASAERAIEKLNTAEESRTAIRSTKLTLNNIQNFLLDRSNEFELIPNFGEMEGISFVPLISQYNRLIAERQRLLINATPKHPDVIKVQESLGNVRANILSGVNLAQKGLNEKEEQIVEQAAPVQRQIQSLPYVQRGLNEITRQVDVKKDLFLFLLQKREEAAIGLAARLQNMRILDEPAPGGEPVAPNKKQSYMLAFLLGLAIPASVLYLKERMNDKILDKDEIKGLTRLPFLGDVAYTKNERSRLISPSSRSGVAEMFRIVRTNLQFLTATIKDKTILVTSNNNNNGKTFISGNLAACLALTNKKTVVLELDLRKPKLTELLTGKPAGTGITDFLVEEKQLKDILQPVEEYPNLYLISAGPTPPNPAELILSERMEELFRQLKERFDFIVIDTPPTDLVTDAYLLNKFATASVFIVRSGKTKKVELKAFEEICQEGKLVNPSVLLNGTKMPKRYGYYYDKEKTTVKNPSKK